MKRLNLRKVIVLLAFLNCSSALPDHREPAGQIATETTPREVLTVDPGLRCQTIEGWGTSLAWWANVLGGWEDERKKNEIADLLFSPESGLGLNIVRYNIGGGTNPQNHLISRMRPGSEIPTFLPSPGHWDWNADANQRWFLEAAKDRGAHIFEAWVDSPPAWMTIDNCTAGSFSAGNNLAPANYALFADYLAEVVKHFRDEWGINFRTVGPMNEPSGRWRCSGNQEGNHVDPGESQRQLIQATAATLQAKGLTSAAVSGLEESSTADTMTSWRLLDQATRDMIGQVNTHTYGWHYNRDALRVLLFPEGKRLWMSERGVGDWQPLPSENHDDPKSALDLADEIIDSLKHLQANAFVYWQAVEGEGEFGDSDPATFQPHNWGLIHANYQYPGHQLPEEYWVTKQYYAMAQYSKFLCPGYTLMNIDDARSVAAFDPGSQTLVIVSMNRGPVQRAISYDLSRFYRVGVRAACYRTSALENLSAVGEVPVTRRVLKADLPAGSITTFVIPGTQDFHPSANLLPDPGFETGAWVPWMADSRASLDGTRARSGVYCALLSPAGESGGRLSQTLPAPVRGRYTLTAFAETNISNGVQLRVEVDGALAAWANVTGGVPWRAYSMAFAAEAGQYICVIYSAPAGDGWARLDDTVLIAGPNLLVNPDFESGVEAPWTREYGWTTEPVVAREQYNGRYSLNFRPWGTAAGRVAQSVKAPVTGRYTLTGFVFGTVDSTMGVTLDGSEVTSKTLPGNSGGYDSVVLTFNARAGQTIRAWFSAPATMSAAWAVADDATLTYECARSLSRRDRIRRKSKHRFGSPRSGRTTVTEVDWPPPEPKRRRRWSGKAHGLPSAAALPPKSPLKPAPLDFASFPGAVVLP